MSTSSSPPRNNSSFVTLDDTATSATTMYESAFDSLTLSSIEVESLSDDTMNPDLSTSSNATLKSLPLDTDEESSKKQQTPTQKTATTTIIPPKTMPSGTSRPIEVYANLEEFDRHLPPTVTLLRTPHGSKVYLVGTAHFSAESQDDVSQVMRNVQPDFVMVELCPSRVHILRHDEKSLLEEARDINFAKIRSIMQSNGAVNGVLYILLLKMTAKLTESLGMAPGGEFRRALQEMKDMPWCQLHLGDRPINITLQRALQGLSTWQTTKLVFRLITSNEDISKEDVEQCKQKDLLEKLIEEMAGEFPSFGDVFVNERDLYLCHSLQVDALHPVRPVKVVGVVGIGHMAGIEKHWMKVTTEMVQQTMQIPPPSRKKKVFKACFRYGLLGVVAYGVWRVARPMVKAIL